LNEVINRKKHTNKLTTTFVSNDKKISSPNEVANHFCKYFTNIGVNLAKDIPNSTVSHRSYLSGNYVNSMSLELTTEEEIVEIINLLRSGTAAGYDNIPISALKNSVSVISEPIAHIINLSISSGIVPDLMKIARVIPLFKSGDYRYFQNYRPVSVLPIFSKLLEKVVFKRITNYIDKSSILSDNQYRFRKKLSTYLAIMRLYDGLTSAIDRREFTVGIFRDLSKAFDTVNHDILFNKLQHYGIRRLALDWIKSYFFNRLQYVQHNDTSSTYKIIKCGVPQGSILGPLVSSIY
jgi:hypothetical protein